jgi:predicted CXXCH cytochrome family protein
MLKEKLNRNLFGSSINKKWIAVGFIFAFTIVLVACSPKTGSGVLKFFFDGVPEKTKQDSAILTVASDSSKKNTLIPVQPANPGLYYHPPYKERACSKCHNSEVHGKTAYSQDEACYTCHTDFQKQYPIVHGPVAGGFCTACHAPHYSENKKLLLRRGQDMCLNCHSKNLVMKNDTHADIGRTSCTECHNPHGGSDRYLSN